MKQIIKSASIYKADMGMNADALDKALATKAFTECQPEQIASFGFIPVSPAHEECPLVVRINGGFAFRIRLDIKQIRAQAMRAKADEILANDITIQDRKPSKDEKAAAREQAARELARHTYPKTASIICFYQEATKYLILPTTSHRYTDLITSMLVAATGSVKTETIHVSSVKHGLTARLNRWNKGEEDAFGVFHPCSEAALQQDKRRIKLQMGSLHAAQSGIKEALASSFEVTSLGLAHNGETEFRLSDDFKLKSIRFAHTDQDDEEDPSFYAQASLELDALGNVITDLIEMIGHGKNADEENKETPNA